MGLPRRWSRSLLSETTSGLDDGCTRVVVHEYGVVHDMGARVVHEYGVVQEYRVVHENEWCRGRSGARDWCMSTSGA